MKHYREEYLEVGNLEIDPACQRPEDPHKISAIEKDFDEAALGVLTVSHREKPEQYIILDGQSRRKAVLLRFGKEGLVPCHVYDNLSKEQEADLFLKLNFTTKPKVIEKFPVRVTRGDEAAVEIQRILGQHGWKVSNQPANGNVNAIAAVERIWELSQKVEAEPNLVEAVIITISRAWGIDRYGAQGAIFEGLGWMFAEYGCRIELYSLVQMLRG